MRATILVLTFVIGSAGHRTTAQERITLDGAWLVTSFNGQANPGNSEVTLTITGTSYEQAINGHVNERGTITIDAVRKPIAIDFLIAEGPDQNTRQLGIAEVTGETLKLHLNQPGSNERPADFTPRPDSMLITARRR